MSRVRYQGSAFPHERIAMQSGKLIHKRKVKTGCRTCKIRKVKCDEARSACDRCVFSGRACDGYGVWDVLPVKHEHQSQVCPKEGGSSPLTNRIAILPTCSHDEWSHLEWLLQRSVTKLPGTFLSSFWTTLLMQASFTEPAVFHAGLALASAHRDGHIVDYRQHSSDAVSTCGEDFLLRQYIKSVKQLQGCTRCDPDQTRVVLTSCITYAHLEFLRGHFEIAQIHIQKGLRIWNETATSQSRDTVPSSTGLVEQWIAEALSRLYFALKLFKPSLKLPSPYRSGLISGSSAELGAISSLKDAWTDLQLLFDQIFTIEDQVRSCNKSLSNSALSGLKQYQQRIASELQYWLQAYKKFVESPIHQLSYGLRKAYRILFGYFHMAGIKASVALQPDDEMTYDRYTNSFLSIIAISRQIWENTRDDPASEELDEEQMRRSIADPGWIPPLYFTATKCRVHQIRIQAIRLLQCSRHRESIFDSSVMACAAKRILELEEGTFYGSYGLDDDCDLERCLRTPDLMLPILPEKNRIHGVELVLSGSPLHEIQIVRSQRVQGIEAQCLLSRYNIKDRCWL